MGHAPWMGGNLIDKDDPRQLGLTRYELRPKDGVRFFRSLLGHEA